MFERARLSGTGLWSGPNPIDAVPKRKVPHRLPVFFRWEEVPLVLDAFAGRPQVQEIVAMALYTGQRKGEILGLYKSNVNWSDETIVFNHSYDGDSNKNDKENIVPIAPELRPYLERAFERDRNSPLVFPHPDGGMYTKEFDLAAIIRRGAARAGLVKGYEHRCRKQGCGFKELRATDEQSRCPRCGRALWPKAVPKDYRFHHLRHTNASSLLKLRESLPLVQDILGHADPETTRRIYGHLELDDKRRALAQLRFRLPAGNGHGAAPASGTRAGGEAGVNGAPAVRPPESEKTEAADPSGNRSEISGLVMSGRQDLHLRPLAPQAGAYSGQGTTANARTRHSGHLANR
jgi:integrase